MPVALAYIAAARLWLETNTHPVVPALLLILAIWAPQYAIRRWRPTWWQWFATFGGKASPEAGSLVEYALKAWQAVPSLMLGGLAGALSTGGDPWGAVVGALLGGCAPVKHHALKAFPFLSYRGGAAPAASPAPPTKMPPLAGALLLALLPGAIAILLTLTGGQ